MNGDRHRTYCTLDHANKRRELARQTPHQFWMSQLRRDSEVREPGAQRARNRSESGNKPARGLK